MKAPRKTQSLRKFPGLQPDPAQPLPIEDDGAAFAAFDSQVLRRPDYPAVTDGSGTWSYRQLHDASQQIAWRLLCHGIQPKHLVAVYAHRSRPLIPALLGIRKAGAAFLILDPAFPPARLVQILRLALPQGLLELDVAGKLTADLADFAESHPWHYRKRISHSDLTGVSSPSFPCPPPLPDCSADSRLHRPHSTR